MKCLLCGKPLAKIARLMGNGEFCCREHREAYRLRQGLNQVLEADHMAQLARRREQPMAMPLPVEVREGGLEPRVCIPAPPAAARRAGDCFTPPLRVAGEVGLKPGSVQRSDFPGNTVPHAPRAAAGRASMHPHVTFPAHQASLAAPSPGSAGFLAPRTMAAPAARPQACLEPSAWSSRTQLPRGRFRIHRPALPAGRGGAAERLHGPAPASRRAVAPVWFGARPGRSTLPGNRHPELRGEKPDRSAAPARKNYPAHRHSPAVQRSQAFESFLGLAPCVPPAPIRRRPPSTRIAGLKFSEPHAAAAGTAIQRATSTAFPVPLPLLDNLHLAPRQDGGAMAATITLRDIAAPSHTPGPAIPQGCEAEFRYAAVVLPEHAPVRQARLRSVNPAAGYPPAREAIQLARACDVGTAAAPELPRQLQSLRGGLAGTLVSKHRPLALVPMAMSGAPRPDEAQFAAPSLWYPPANLNTRGGLTGAPPAGETVQEDFAAGLRNWAGGVEDWRLDIAGARIGSLALFVPSLGMRDYDLEFVAKIESSTVCWVLRAADFRNYYSVAIEALPGGRGFQLTRHAVAEGIAEPAATVPFSLAARAKSALHIHSTVSGPEFTIAIEDQIIATWSDPRFQTGGIGFLAAPEDRARLYRLQLSPRGQQRVPTRRGRSDRK